jgi:uncharacterized membrane protein (DUF373 family)
MNPAIEKFKFILTTVIRVHAFAAATFLAAYMCGTLVFSIIDFLQNFQGFVNPALEGEETKIRYSVLHSLAFIIVLYKAFTILIAYGTNMHVNIKFILEIAIIGSVVEFIFNYKSLSDILILAYATVFILTTFAYFYFYEKLEDPTDVDHS